MIALTTSSVVRLFTVMFTDPLPQFGLEVVTVIFDDEGKVSGILIRLLAIQLFERFVTITL